MNRRTRLAVEALVSGVILVVVLWISNPEQIWQTLSHARPGWLALALIVQIATIPVMAYRWQLLLDAKGIHQPMGWLTRTYYIALFAGQFLPAAIGGDAVRAVELGRRTHDAPEAVASVLIDRVVGVISLVALAAVSIAAGGHSAAGPEVLVVEIAFGLAALAVLGLLFSSRVRGLAARVLEPRSDGRPLIGGERFYDALHSYRNHRVVLVVVGVLALGVQIARIGTIWMLVQALNLDVPISSIFITGPVLFVALILPVSINGIGVREAVFVYFLRDYTTPGQAFALGVAFFALTTATAMVGGLLLAFRFVRYGVEAARPRRQLDEAGEQAAKPE